MYMYVYNIIFIYSLPIKRKRKPLFYSLHNSLISTMISPKVSRIFLSSIHLGIDPCGQRHFFGPREYIDILKRALARVVGLEGRL